MISKGTMIPVKKILGGALVLIAVGLAGNIGIIKDLLTDSTGFYAYIGVLAASGYFLIKSGYQN